MLGFQRCPARGALGPRQVRDRACVRYDQMYSSAMAPSRHFATVTMRPPPSNSPTTQVHSPDPNLIGCETIWGGLPPAESTYAFIASMCCSIEGVRFSV